MDHSLPIHEGDTVRIGNGTTDWSVVEVDDLHAELCAASGTWRRTPVERLRLAPVPAPDPYDPWEHWKAYEALGWRLYIVELPVGYLGFTRWGDRTVWLSHKMGQAQARTTLAHELVHIERNTRHADAHGTPADELEVDEIVAHRLVPLDHLLSAIAWATELVELADELRVDQHIARLRLKLLTREERALVAAACPQGIDLGMRQLRRKSRRL